MNDEIIHQSLEKQLAEATEEKGDLKKTNVSLCSSRN